MPLSGGSAPVMSSLTQHNKMGLTPIRQHLNLPAMRSSHTPVYGATGRSAYTRSLEVLYVYDFRQGQLEAVDGTVASLFLLSGKPLAVALAGDRKTFDWLNRLAMPVFAWGESRQSLEPTV